MTTPIVIAVLIAFVVKMIVPADTVLKIIAEIMIFVVIYGIFVWKFAMNDYEKSLVQKPINKILSKVRG